MNVCIGVSMSKLCYAVYTRRCIFFDSDKVVWDWYYTRLCVNINRILLTLTIYKGLHIKINTDLSRYRELMDRGCLLFK